jgi:hypothetical protein
MNLANLCPIPLAWAPYIMDSKTPFDPLKMGRDCLVAMRGVHNRIQALPLLDWLQASCVWLRANLADCHQSLVNQNYEATTPDTHVLKWIHSQGISSYVIASVILPMTLGVVRNEGAPVLPTEALTLVMPEKGNTPCWRHPRSRLLVALLTNNGPLTSQKGAPEDLDAT